MKSVGNSQNVSRRYKLKSAMQSLSEETGVKKELLLKENRGPIERFTMKGKLAKQLDVKRKDLNVPRSGPIELSGKALSKIADHASKALVAQSGSHIDLLAVSLLGGPVALEHTLNGETRIAAEVGLSGTKANLGQGGEHPTETWARTSDGWGEVPNQDGWLTS